MLRDFITYCALVAVACAVACTAIVMLGFWIFVARKMWGAMRRGV